MRKILVSFAAAAVVLVGGAVSASATYGTTPSFPSGGTPVTPAEDAPSGPVTGGSYGVYNPPTLTGGTAPASDGWKAYLPVAL